MSIPSSLVADPSQVTRTKQDPTENWAKRIVRDLGITISSHKVCREHHSPSEVFYDVLLKRPSIALIHGSRGAGKSYLAALETHLSSLQNPRLHTRILGGSQAQSKQIYEALQEIRERPSQESKRLSELEESFARYENGSEVQIVAANAIATRYSNHSEVAILAASSRSVRGPHVQSLRLDEVDEIPFDIRESAMGMCMAKDGIPASVIMTSTWHRVNGSMAGLIEQARSGAFPLYTMCAFEVLERCPESRSGVHLENCPDCPLFRYCHSQIDEQGRPKAKRSDGHYTIDSLIQKLRMTSTRTFESDYLCLEPRADGAWFTSFDPVRHVSEDAEYDPALPVYLAIDSGVFTGAVFFQIAPGANNGGIESVRVFADYLSENLSAERNAREILNCSLTFSRGRIDVISTDPAGGARNPVGPTVIGEYERVGLRPLNRWPQTPVADGLALIDAFLTPADGRSRFIVHPRCELTIQSLRFYRRAKRAGQWQDYPEDPQHPHEDIIDALRGGLLQRYPQGRYQRGQDSFARISARKVF